MLQQHGSRSSWSCARGVGLSQHMHRPLLDPDRCVATLSTLMSFGLLIAAYTCVSCSQSHTTIHQAHESTYTGSPLCFLVASTCFGFIQPVTLPTPANLSTPAVGQEGTECGTCMMSGYGANTYGCSECIRNTARTSSMCKRSGFSSADAADIRSLCMNRVQVRAAGNTYIRPNSDVCTKEG